ncbi:uncharacterized protein A4U43_C10F6620 [Asparagus officinalis]|uniref:Uncharacterized protein n=1 Tax=Asparagus officinalis TaxID=4686 RepID=A0A5P1E148_ASPOF|nr:uncharacterized protein A4U43_C10F6620 [Asparagus officinalis]
MMVGSLKHEGSFCKEGHFSLYIVGLPVGSIKEDTLANDAPMNLHEANVAAIMELSCRIGLEETTCKEVQEVNQHLQESTTCLEVIDGENAEIASAIFEREDTINGAKAIIAEA